MHRLTIVALMVAACGSAPAKPTAAPAPVAPAAPAPAPAASTTCPATQPKIDSSCEGFAPNLGCLYANDAIGCSCMATSPGERSEDAPWKQVWRCGEHGEE